MGLIHKLGQNAAAFLHSKTLKTTCAGRTDCTLQRVTAFHISCVRQSASTRRFTPQLKGKAMLKNFTMPKKFSYPKKPITVTAEVNMTGERMTGKIKKKIINRATELAGIVPFDWTMVYEEFVAYFGFETWESALAAQARLQDSNFHSHLWDYDVENQITGKLMRQAEAEGYEVRLCLHNDESVDWKNDPAFAERKSH